MNVHLDWAITRMRQANIHLNNARGEAPNLKKEFEIATIQDELSELMNRLRELYKEEK